MTKKKHLSSIKRANTLGYKKGVLAVIALINTGINDLEQTLNSTNLAKDLEIEYKGAQKTLMGIHVAARIMLDQHK